MKYSLVSNHCNCHPETCCCSDFRIVDEKGEKVASGMNKDRMNNLINQANQGGHMDSPNVAHVPLNPAGALELGLWPCDWCNMGWGEISSSGSKSCRDTCQHYQEAIKKKSHEILKGLGLDLKEGETLKIVKVKKEDSQKV